ncbi:MAG: exo-beta-N-acetylmuramidase NamZ family protein [Bacteroidales bacterium]
MKKRLLILSFCFLFLFSLLAQSNPVKVGAEATTEYMPLLKGKRIAVLTNQTGMLGNEHLVDFLFRKKCNMTAIFSPEHGFRGDADAGEHVSSSVDSKTGIPIYSLYDGDTGKPKAEVMKNVDIMLFDLQDVGLRYYTYLTTMARMMDACAENGVKMLVLDRPNPNGHYVDGPILDMKHKSAVGWLPIPIVHGMTLGELALMINGEKWLPEGRQCDLKVVKCQNYTHQTMYELPVAPSPNLPNMRSVYLYPVLCFFEATPVSLGRGTEFPFQTYGHPNMKGYSFEFTPRSVPGAKQPPLLNKTCYGIDMRTEPSNEEVWKNGVDLTPIIDAYTNLNLGDHFFRPFFEKLVGVDYVRKMIKQGKSATEIRSVWSNDVEMFKKQRAPYLLYPDNQQ